MEKYIKHHPFLIFLPTISVFAQCDAPLGFQNKAIKDEQLSATSEVSSYTARQARIRVGSGWTALFTNNQYLEVDLLTLHVVARYSIQGSTNSMYSETVALFYSEDRLVWDRYITSDGNDTIKGNTNSRSIKTYDLIPSIKTRYLVFQPVKTRGKPSLRLELYGCQVEDPRPTVHTSINQDVVDIQEWILSQSPYVLNSMITIGASGHVKVQPGVKVVFNSSSAGLLVHGTLEVNGVNEQPVVFSSSRPDIIQPKWMWIEVVLNGNLTLEYCEIRQAETGIKGPLSSITVRNCHIHHNNAGVYLTMGDTDPERTQFVGARITDNRRAIYGSNWESGSKYLSLQDSHLTRNGYHALSLETEAVVVAENTLFSHSEHGIYQYYYGVTLTMRNCSITHNRRSGVRLYNVRETPGLAVDITNSMFSNNGDEAINLQFQYLPELATTLISVTNSTFTSNGGEVIGIFGSDKQRKSTVLIRNNSFIGLRGDRAIRVECVNIKIHENVFSNFTKSPTIYTNAPNTTISRNVFLNPETEYDLMVDVNFTVNGRLNASYNYWGSRDKIYVRSRICDFFCDMNMVIAEFHPFYTSQSLTDLSAELNSHMFSQASDTIGGILSESLTLGPHQYLFVNRSLYVPEGYQLTILENVTLVFHYKQGIFVKGSLEIQGVEDGKVILTTERYVDLRWSGLVFNSTGSTLRHVVLANSQVGLLITTNNTGSIVMTDSVITQCDMALTGDLWADVAISLHRVNINESSTAIRLSKMSQGTVTLILTDSYIDGNSDVFLWSRVDGGHFNVNMNATNILVRNGGFNIDSCKTSITLNMNNASVTTSGQHAINLVGGPVNIQLKRSSVPGFSVQVCALPSRDPGIIDIQESNFSGTDDTHALNIRSSTSYCPPHTVLLINNAFNARKNFNLDVDIHTNPWTVEARGNIFLTDGINLRGCFANIYAESNIFERIQTAFKSIFTCKKGGSKTVFNGNTVHGGTLNLLSEQTDDEFIIRDNIFNGSLLVIKSPNTSINQNVFLNSREFYVKFQGNGHAEKGINCTFNYWGTEDKREIDILLYDSYFKKTLPTLNFIPYYRFPNLTDLQYPEDINNSPNGTIGGKIRGRVTLTASGSPYTVTANIEVEELHSLIIEPGVSLLFTKGLGISVKGRMEVLGNRTHPVEANPLVPGEKWAGVKLHGHLYESTSLPPDNIRLVGGKDEREGRVEVNKNGTWGTVCDRRFDDREASVICGMLGYDPSIRHSTYYDATFGRGSGPIWFQNLECTGSEKTLDECLQNRFGCYHSEDAGVRCLGELLPTPADVDNEVLLHYFHLNDTENGLELSGNITSIQGVVSTHSRSHGFNIHVGLKGLTKLEMEDIVTSHNAKSGISFTSSLATNDYLQLVISGCEISSNGQDGIDIDRSVNLSIINCQLGRNKEKAIRLDRGAIINITQTVIFENEKGVLSNTFFQNGVMKLNVRDSHIVGNDMRRYRGSRWLFHQSLFQIYRASLTESSYTFVNNTFDRNFGQIMTFDFFTSEIDHFIFIANNTFKDNNATIVSFNPPYRNNVNFYFKNNTMENNTAPDYLQPLLQILYRIDSNGSRVEISHNKFFKNTAPQMVNLVDIRKLEGNTNITKNIFKNNNCTNTIKTSVFDFVLKDNVFNNPLAKCELEAPFFDRWYSIDARRNYWGQQNTETVYKRICGFDLDMNRGFVSYLPHYMSEELHNLSNDLHTDFFIRDLHGGVVEGRQLLDRSKSPYYIRRSIFIREAGKLEIDGGVEMRFHPNTGIYVDGLILARGSSDGITLLPATNASWFGVVFPFKIAGVSKKVRLINGTNPSEGRVELLVNGQWSTLCNLDMTGAQLLCQALGYGSRQTQIITSGFGEGSGPVLYNLECQETMSSLSQCQPILDTISYCDFRNDVGLKCNQFVAGIQELSHLEMVSILDSKEGLLIQTPTVRLSNCHINNTENAGLTLDTDAIDLDLNGTVVEHGMSDGIVIKVPKYFNIRNGTSQHNEGDGMTFNDEKNNVIIENMQIVNNTKNGIVIMQPYTNRDLHITLRRNAFMDHTKDGFALKIVNEYRQRYDDIVKIENNDFMHNLAGSIDIVTPWMYYANQYIAIRGNTFLSSGNISIFTPNYVSAHIEDNIAKNCTGDNECFLVINIFNRNDRVTRNVTLVSNTFEETHGKCVVYLKSTDDNLNGTVAYNQISSSSTEEAAVVLDSSRFTLHHNIFDNPSANYELQVEKTGSGEIKADTNWWGTTDPFTAGARILHKEQDQRLLRVDYTPILTSRPFGRKSTIQMPTESTQVMAQTTVSLVPNSPPPTDAVGTMTQSSQSTAASSTAPTHIKITTQTPVSLVPSSPAPTDAVGTMTQSSHSTAASSTAPTHTKITTQTPVPSAPSATVSTDDIRTTTQTSRISTTGSTLSTDTARTTSSTTDSSKAAETPISTRKSSTSASSAATISRPVSVSTTTSSPDITTSSTPTQPSSSVDTPLSDPYLAILGIMIVFIILF